MKVVQLKAAGEPLTPESEDAAVKAVVGETTHCDKCKEPKSPLMGRLMWIEGSGVHPVRICAECEAEIKIATDKKIAELKQPKIAEEAP